MSYISNEVYLKFRQSWGQSLPGDPDAFFRELSAQINVAAVTRVSVAQFPGFVADGVTNIDPAIKAAMAAGYTRLWLPAPCLWIPDDNTTYEGLDIEGEDWERCVISVADRATDNRVFIGGRSIIRTCAFISKWQDDNVVPLATPKTCPSFLFLNVSDSPQPASNWMYKSITVASGPSVTGPGGVVSDDVPGIGVNIEGTTGGGDGFYAASFGAAASAIRVLAQGDTVDNPTRGIFLINGRDTEDQAQLGLHMRGMGDGSLTPQNQSTIRIDRIGGERSLFINDDEQTAGLDGNWIALNAAEITSGDIINIFHSGSTWTGDGLQINSGAGGGSHTGNFLRFQKAATNVYRVVHDGSVIQSVPASANTLAVNSTMTFHLASNTSLVVSVRGTDGTTRTGAITLS